MKNIQFKEIKGYESPQSEILLIVPETVLCTSGDNDQITGSTGSNWYEGEDAQW